ncbi:MAG: PKD domain-containing protein, partial [Ruminiclostridium sp.]
GELDSLDLAEFKICLLNSEHKYQKEMDVNLDNAVDAVDFAIYKKYLLGEITSLPVETTVENKSPVAAFTVSPKEAFTGDDIGFDATASTDPDGSVVVYAWDLGDGTESTGAKVIHKYKAPGTYTIKLTVSDDKGLPNTVTDSVTITTATGDNAEVNFEDGSLNGFTSNTTASALSVTSEKAFQGTKSLKWDATGSVDGKVDAEINSSVPVLAPGQTMTFRVWIPADAPIKTIQPFVMPHDASWGKIEWYSAWKSYDTVNKGSWNEFTVTLPLTADTTLTQVQYGVQVETSAEGNFTMYVDSIDW